MALPTSGPLSLNDIAGEFGGATPHSLSEYYGVAAGIPTSGTISISDFYGASAFTPYDLSGFNNSVTYNQLFFYSYAAYGVQVSNSGSYLIINPSSVSNGLEIFSTNTPYTFNSSTVSSIGTLSGLPSSPNINYFRYNSTGTLLWVSDGGYQHRTYSSSVPFSTNSANYTLISSATFPLYAGGYYYSSPNLNDNGINMIASTRASYVNLAHAITLSSSFNVSSYTFSSNLNMNPVVTGDYDMKVKYTPDGNRFHTWRYNLAAPMYQYVMSTPFDVSTGTFEYSWMGMYPVGSGVQDYDYNPAGDKFYVLQIDPMMGYYVLNELRP
jgi:hypothetical protein